MTYVVNKLVTLEELLKSARWKPIRCKDPICEHKAPVLYACSMSYRGHRVRVIQDWDCFSVQLDGDSRLMVENVSHAQMVSFVEKLVRQS